MAPDPREAAWFAVYDALPAYWLVGPVTFDPGRGAFSVTARAPHPGRGRISAVVSGVGETKVAALVDLHGCLAGMPRPADDAARRAALNRRLRQAFYQGAEEQARRGGPTLAGNGGSSAGSGGTLEPPEDWTDGLGSALGHRAKVVPQPERRRAKGMKGMTEPLAWTSVSPSGGTDESTRSALDELERVAAQYKRYVELSRITELPSVIELGHPTPYEAPTGDRPLGLVIDATTPMGFHLTDRA